MRAATQSDWREYLAAFMPMWLIRRGLVGVLAVGLLTSGCAAKQRHYAVAADYAFATAVAAVDDALFSACQSHAIAADVCNDQIKPKMITVDTSVLVASKTLRALPDNASMPKAIPDLITSLHGVQDVLDALGDLTNPMVQRIVSLLSKAVAEATSLLYLFTGGQ